MKKSKKVLIALLVAGFILALGTAGSSDQETISDTRMYVQLAIATAMASAGFFGIYIMERKEIRSGNYGEKLLLWAECECKKESDPGTHNTEVAQGCQQNVDNYFNYHITTKKGCQE